MAITLDDQFQNTLNLLENSDESIFITGKAGTGKSTLLSHFIAHTNQNIVVLAPTGVAALNVKGETIHSFFHFKVGVNPDDARNMGKRIKKDSLYNAIDMIIIDEVSMVRADLLDSVDQFLQEALRVKRPFGGIKMIFIGDLYQLPPVVTSQEKPFFEQLYDSPYFFSSNVLKNENFKLQFVELEKIYRQKDQDFIELLNAIRKNTITDEQLFLLNKRVVLDFKNDEGYIYLTSTNQAADKTNQEKLLNLKGKNYCFNADIEGDFEIGASPTEKDLNLKIGAQVMFLTNHNFGLWVNGTIGTILDIKKEKIIVKTQEGEKVEVEKHEWDLYKYAFDEKNKTITQDIVGSFIQYPLKLAWAITIHKSQGKTFEKVVVDLDRGAFAHGQTYVALSRCTTFEGLILKKPLKKGNVIMDFRVVNFLTHFQYSISEKKCSLETKMQIIQKAIETKSKLSITYLKTTDEKSHRIILPSFLGEMVYQDKPYIGLQAYCLNRQETRVFKVDRILELEIIP
ncbi:MAG: AAA family ATPase [Chlamydiae bacterium]|nr:AAA family ATPase [Chlamydiota bacterium]